MLPYFFFQTVDYIQAALDFVQLAGLKVKFSPQIPDLFGQVVGIGTELGELCGQSGSLGAHVPSSDHGVLRLFYQRGRTLLGLVSRQGKVGPLHRVNEFACIAEELPPLGEFLVLPWPELRTLQLTNLESEAVYAPGFFCLIHFQGGHFPADGIEGMKGVSVFLQLGGGSAKAVQIIQVAALVQELLSVVLAVDVQ